MMEPETQETQTVRQNLSVALLNVQPSDVMTVAEAFAARYEIRHKRVPKSGLGMMRFRESVMAQAFNIGEVPMSSAHVELVDALGNVHEGGAVILQDDEALAVAIAICDAALSGGLDEEAAVQRLVNQGLKARAHEAQIRHTMLERSKVCFALMNQDAAGELD